MKKWIKKIFLYLFIILGLSLFLSRCLILKMRWSDRKAARVFKTKDVPLEIYDTVINDRHIHYAATGSRSLPTLVFIHGSPGSWMHYMKFMWDKRLREKFRIVVFDRPGFGHSDFDKPLHLQEQSALLLPVIRQIKTDQPMFICGHSYGGPLVIKLAAEEPGLFKKLLITSGSIDPKLEKKESWRHLMKNKPLSWFLPGAFKPSNTEILYLKEDLKLLANDFQKIKTEVQFIHGDKDTWVPIENIAYGKKMLVNAASITMDTIRGADHQVPWKNREEFITLLLRLK